MSTTHEALMANLLADPELAREWEAGTIARAIANQVIRYRVDHGLSQRTLAARLGVSAALVGRLELGEHEPRLSTLQMLTRKLGIRFSIDIYPAGASERPATGELRIERAKSDGVETVVSMAAD